MNAAGFRFLRGLHFHVKKRNDPAWIAISFHALPYENFKIGAGVRCFCFQGLKNRAHVALIADVFKLQLSDIWKQAPRHSAACCFSIWKLNWRLLLSVDDTLIKRCFHYMTACRPPHACLFAAFSWLEQNRVSRWFWDWRTGHGILPVANSMKCVTSSQVSQFTVVLLSFKSHSSARQNALVLFFWNSKDTTIWDSKRSI